MTDPEMPKDLPVIKLDLDQLRTIVFPKAILGDVEEPIACIDGRADADGSDKAEDEEGELTVEQKIAKDLVEATGQIFEAEHTLLEPPKPREPSEDNFEYENFMEEPIRNSYINEEVDVPPTLEERIKNTQAAAKFSRNSERLKGNSRTRENFGQEFRIATKFNLDTVENSYIRQYQREAGKEVVPARHDMSEVAGLTNRVSLYRYLQQRGLVLMDDTGLSAYANDADRYADHTHGFFVLARIDRQATVL